MRRNTAQRTIILETLQKAKSHPSVEWLYNEVRKVLPHISLGTVYRNLN
ncbi:MAG TPA: transcriptional repressor, partial [Candidatus Marinimicrobia bacterium]|nr:transcriptional repressor [Candidatus Neomarinimicrobiota bacterium]